MKRDINQPAWQEVLWQRPFEAEAVQDFLTHLASVTPRGAIVFEIRGNSAGVQYLFCCDRPYLAKLKAVFAAHGNVQFADAAAGSRQPVREAKQLKITRPSLSLNTDLTLAVVRAGLSALLQTPKGEQTVLQIVLGPSFSPAPMPRQLLDPYASWLQVALGHAGPASAESRRSIQEKRECHGFSAVVRLGATGKTATAHILNLLSALRTLESAGVSIKTEAEKAESLNDFYVPWHFRLQLSIKELSNFLLLPVGDTELPGAAGLHPKLLLPPVWYSNPEQAHDRTFAHGIGPAEQTKLSISPQDSLEHSIVIGPTGSGKSTVMVNMILSDIRSGRSVLVVDPKADLVNDVLARIPESRDSEVVVIDPSDACPVGFNPLAFQSGDNPGLVADSVLAVFQQVFKDNWGIRSQDVLSAALLTLAQTPGASLLWLPTLLTDEAFRRKITTKVTDKLGLGAYWDGFDAMKDSKQRMEIAPVLNKVRQFLLRPGLRNVLGQSDPKFSMADLFNKPRVVLVPLNKGIIGAESARLLGSLIVGTVWTLALSRAKVPAERRRLVSMYIDELQDYLSLPTDLSDALAQARGLGMGITMAHQYRDQLPKEIRAGVDANARNKICFGLNAGDAREMAAMAPELEAEDFMRLPRYQVYTSFQQNGRNTGWVMGQTIPPPAALRFASELRAKSMAAYGQPAEEVERAFLALRGDPEDHSGPLSGAIGRRTRS